VEIWFEAVEAFLVSPPDEMIFELHESPTASGCWRWLDNIEVTSL
jgi:hypothetical protein